MSRREYPVADRYEDRESEFYRRPRRDREYDDLEVDITRSRYPESRRAETVVRERDSSVGDRRTERSSRKPDFLREDYGKSSAGELVIREEVREETRAPSRRRSVETVRSRAPPERIERDEYILKERDRSDRGLPYPRSQRSEVEYREVDKEEVVYRDRARSRAPPAERSKEEIDITIRREESERRPAPPPPRSEVRERDEEIITFRRGGGERPKSRVIEREEIDIRESRSPAPPPPRSVADRDELEIDIRERRSDRRGREVVKEEIDIRERSVPPPRQRSMSRPALVARKEEEWIVRRQRTPPPREKDYEKEEIIIRRKEKSPEPEPPREPTPEPPPPPPVEPIYRPPIIQEIITHHRHYDHGVERARSPSPPPPPPSPPREREEELEIEIKRKGVRNGKAYEEDILIERDITNDKGGEERDVEREVEERRSVSRSTRRRSPSPAYRRYEDELAAEADFYNRKVSSRAYPGEAYNGATKDWGLVDVPPGTERVRMDGVGGGRQEITWQGYNGERRGKFVSGDRIYESEFANGHSSPPPLPPAPAPPPPRENREVKEEIKITETRTTEERPAPRKRRDRMWTEVTKDLVIKEAIEESGYEYEETNDHFYIIEYLKYEDVLRLVEVTEDIRRERNERIRELQWERERADRGPKLLIAAPPPPPVPAPPRSNYDERIYEKEIRYDRSGRRYR